jgi:AcrR family transcriptional regulator
MSDLATASSSRGRPPKEINRGVIEHLMLATEAALMGKAASELTIREIAAEAGVSSAMINYYFGGKDGLQVAMLHEVMKDAPYARYESISQDCVAQKSIRPLIEQLAQFYYSRPGLMKMAISEMIAESSTVKAAYRARYFDCTPVFVERVIQLMIDLGIYSRHTNSTFMTSSILSMLCSPLFSISEKFSISDKIKRQDWVNHVSQIVDLSMIAPLSSEANKSGCQ